LIYSIYEKINIKTSEHYILEHYTLNNMQNNPTIFNDEREGGYVRTGEGNKMKFVRGKGGYVKTGYENKMKWVIGDGEWVKTGEDNKMEWKPNK